MEANIIDNVPVVIIGSRNGGDGLFRRGHGCRPSGGYVLVLVVDNRPALLEYVNDL
jgi:hypothetical protein